MALNSALARGREFEEAIGQVQSEATTTTGVNPNRGMDLDDAIASAEVSRAPHRVCLAC